MFSGKLRDLGWQGGSLVAITYVFFLIFAQFAFLRRLAELGIAGEHLKPVMAAMALGGITISLLAPRVRLMSAAAIRLRIGLTASGAAALLSLLPLTFGSALLVSLLIGAGLGLLTVTLVTHLRQFAGNRSPLFAVGLGTGAGYFACNIPGFFNASPELQSMVAALLCLIGLTITLAPLPRVLESQAAALTGAVSFPLALCGFTALVWLDSAAFYIIQNTPALKAGTWQGTVHLWTNGVLHLVAALLSAWLLSRKGLMSPLTAAFLALGGACLLLHNPGQILAASVFYPIGVSLYSVALVAYPALLAPAANEAERGKIAGWLYAVAGWMGSGLGIGMGQDLGYIPVAFVAVAGIAVLLPQALKLLSSRRREFALVALVMSSAFVFDRLVPEVSGSPMTHVERGRQVYISEGCIHCHSQYVRPHSSDVLMWGPITSISELRRQDPPLIGNRRQGPDLSEVGARRSALWLKMHFYNPAEVSGASIMPNYGFLFNDERGDDLVAYLESLNGAGRNAQQRELEERWQPSLNMFAQADAYDGEALYQRDCATCHDANGATRHAWKAQFRHVPTDLAKGPFNTGPSADTAQQRSNDLARITKFGIAGTDMPGHEYLSDRDVASLSVWLEQVSHQTNQTNRNP